MVGRNSVPNEKMHLANNTAQDTPETTPTSARDRTDHTEQNNATFRDTPGATAVAHAPRVTKPLIIAGSIGLATVLAAVGIYALTNQQGDTQGSEFNFSTLVPGKSGAKKTVSPDENLNSDQIIEQVMVQPEPVKSSEVLHKSVTDLNDTEHAYVDQSIREAVLTTMKGRDVLALELETQRHIPVRVTQERMKELKVDTKQHAAVSLLHAAYVSGEPVTEQSAPLTTLGLMNQGFNMDDADAAVKIAAAHFNQNSNSASDDKLLQAFSAELAKLPYELTPWAGMQDDYAGKMTSDQVSKASPEKLAESIKPIMVKIKAEQGKQGKK